MQIQRDRRPCPGTGTIGPRGQHRQHDGRCRHFGLGVGTMWLLIALGSPAEITGLLALVTCSAAIYLLQSRLAARSVT